MVNLDELNDKQKSAVLATDGPVLILAGAGSGKTKTLMHRIAYILDQKLAQPSEMYVVTFTNKAAGEMKERIAKLLGKKTAGSVVPWMGTFHSMCARMLRQHAAKIGMQANFSIYDPADQTDAVKAALKKLDLSSKDVKPKAVHSYISFAKNELIGPSDYASHAQGYFQEIVAQVYPLYQDILKDNNAMDFDDLLMRTVELFSKAPEVLKSYQQQFKYIMVDEYQDTNHVQYKLVTQLAAGHGNICCVGDDDQSIYSFRGANIRNILNFEKDYPKAKVVKLEQNYRSTEKILEAAHQVIQHNKKRKEKKLWTEKGSGSQILLYTAENEHDEGKWVCAKIEQAEMEGASLSDMAVLYRTNAQSRSLEEQFLREGINYRVVGGIRFYERKEIRDILAYLRVLYNSQDDASVLRIINLPRRGIGAKTIADVQAQAADAGMSVARYLITHAGQISNASVAKFAKLLQGLFLKSDEEGVVDLINSVLADTGYLSMLQDGSTENEARIENIKELISVAAKFASLEPAAGLSAFLEEVALFEGEIDAEDGEAVTLMTIHAAKGLEFQHVFVVGMEEGLFPHSKVYTEPKQLEEERRLAYVAITRAREYLYITHADTRTYFGQSQSNLLSRFVEDIDDSLLEKRSHLLGDFGVGGGWEEEQGSGAGRQESGVGDFAVGDRVQHDYFGVGKVMAIDEGRLVVDFGPVYKTKELMAEYAPLKKI